MPANLTDSGETASNEPSSSAIAHTHPGEMEAADYEHAVLGLIFFKSISDPYEQRRATALAGWGEQAAKACEGHVPPNSFWVQGEALWARFKTGARKRDHRPDCGWNRVEHPPGYGGVSDMMSRGVS